jgi:hypothetical protein
MYGSPIISLPVEYIFLQFHSLTIPFTTLNIWLISISIIWVLVNQSNHVQKEYIPMNIFTWKGTGTLRLLIPLEYLSPPQQHLHICSEWRARWLLPAFTINCLTSFLSTSRAPSRQLIFLAISSFFHSAPSPPSWNLAPRHLAVHLGNIFAVFCQLIPLLAILQQGFLTKKLLQTQHLQQCPSHLD